MLMSELHRQASLRSAMFQNQLLRKRKQPPFSSPLRKLQDIVRELGIDRSMMFHPTNTMSMYKRLV